MKFKSRWDWKILGKNKDGEVVRLRSDCKMVMIGKFIEIMPTPTIELIKATTETAILALCIEQFYICESA